MNTSIFHFRSSGILAALTVLSAAHCGAQQIIALSPVVVTAHHSDEPLALTIDPRAPAQPNPTQDGADVLRGIPGFAVIRKGGTDGDPVLRGMAGSRLGILVDGDVILGGCGNRMDPPTAYVHPAAFQRVTILKGPQSVLHGSGYSAGVVRFEREPHRLARTGAKLTASVTTGSFGRNDQLATLLAGTPRGFIEAIATRSESDDYRTGHGDSVHSAYQRWNVQVAAGWTPDAHTILEVVTSGGDGEAAYADRAMDGARFARRQVAVHFNRALGSGMLQRVQARTYFNHVDHVMDNYSLRGFTPSAAMSQPAASNPDRQTSGGRASASLLAGRATVDIGVEFQTNQHRVRSTRNQLEQPYTAMSRVADATFRQAGIFAEAARAAGEHHRWVAGLRMDDWQATDRRTSLPLGMSGIVPNPSADTRRHATLGTGFVRLERERDRTTTYVGFGYSSRFPDYWELFSKESGDSVSGFGTQPERTAQVDAGYIVRRAAFTGSVSLFANRVSDYVLIQSGVRKGMRVATIARNIDAAAWGGEATAGLRFGANWKADASITHVRGKNVSDGIALAQQPPLEGRFILGWAARQWSLGAVTRVVAPQRRIAPNQGNIAGQDFSSSPAFTVASLNAGWSFSRHARITAGIDNILDRAYAEHISRSGAAIAGYTQVSRVMEPGRTFWCKMDLAF